MLEAMYLLAGGENPSAPSGLDSIRGSWAARGTPENALAITWKPLNLDMDRPITINAKHSHIGELVLSIWLEQPSAIDLRPPSDRAFMAPYRSLDAPKMGQVTQMPDSAGALDESTTLGFSWTRDGRKREARMLLTTGRGETKGPGSGLPFHAVLLNSRTGSLERDAVLLGRLRARKQDGRLTNALRTIEPRLRRVEDNSASAGPMIWGDIGLRELVPLPAMGEAMTQIARIVLAISSVPGGVVLVDEIENGIHHSILNKVWSALAETAQQFDAQVVATTHSFECLAAAHAALTDGLRFHRLGQATGGSSRCVTIETEDVEAALHHGLEVR